MTKLKCLSGHVYKHSPLDEDEFRWECVNCGEVRPYGEHDPRTRQARLAVIGELAEFKQRHINEQTNSGSEAERAGFLI
jgi:hypothetical protein